MIILNFCLLGKLEVNKLVMPFLILLQTSYLLFTVSTKLQKKFGMQCIKNISWKMWELRKYVIGNFRNFQRTEDINLSSQIHDYYLLINDLAIEDIKLP